MALLAADTSARKRKLGRLSRLGAQADFVCVQEVDGREANADMYCRMYLPRHRLLWCHSGSGGLLTLARKDIAALGELSHECVHAVRAARTTERRAEARSGQAPLLAEHWGQVFAGGAMDGVAAQRLLVHATSFDWSLYRRPGRQEVQAVMRRLRDKPQVPMGSPIRLGSPGGLRRRTASSAL